MVHYGELMFLLFIFNFDMKKITYIFPLLLWILLFVIEVLSFFFQQSKPMYFRAWEYVLNQGKDSFYVPFQPRAYYDGPMSGDLLFTTNFLPKKEEIRRQKFIADEYGFRNAVGTYSKGVDVVLMGTSFVGGAATSQEDLISTILNKKYNIKTYNYATLPLQHFWEDARFIRKPPKYLVIIANETEALQNIWTEFVTPSTVSRNLKAWDSNASWKKSQSIVDLSYSGITLLLKRFSIVKFELRQIYLTILNSLFPRSVIAEKLIKLNIYDPDLDMLFWDSNSYNPLTNKKAVDETIVTLKKSQEALKSRNITLIMAVMVSKTTLYSKNYKNIDSKKESLYLLENEMEKNGIQHVKLLNIMKNQKKLLYTKDDGHWNTLANEIIAQELSKKIKELENNSTNY